MGGYGAVLGGDIEVEGIFSLKGRRNMVIGLRKQYAEALEKFHFYESGLLLAKQDVREIGTTHPSCYTDEQRASIANYIEYKSVVKCLAKDLRELKHRIIEYDKVH